VAASRLPATEETPVAWSHDLLESLRILMSQKYFGYD
jgi:hypothetical protein